MPTPAEAATLIARLAQAEALARVRWGEQFNLVQVNSSGSALGLLHYPGFSEDPFPSLAASWRVDLDTGADADADLGSAAAEEGGSRQVGWEASRHLTALVRYGFSAPIQSLARYGFLSTSAMGRIRIARSCGWRRARAGDWCHG